MEIKLKQQDSNKWLLKAVLIRGNSLASWLSEISLMGLSIQGLEVYAIPDDTGNAAACVVILSGDVKDLGKNEYLQVAEDVLLIPQRTDIYPQLLKDELQQLLGHSKYLFYPGFGLVQLSRKVNWTAHLQLPMRMVHRIQPPAQGYYAPQRVKSFQVLGLDPEVVMAKLEEGFPEKTNKDLSPLNLLEKGRLTAYRLLLGDSEVYQDKESQENTLINKMWRDFESLELRNQNHVDRLLTLLKTNPEEALKYAIPLDNNGSFRGENTSAGLDWARRWLNFSLAPSSQAQGSGSVDLGERFFDLQAQYERTAELLVKEKQYEKAAFIYLKLLKNYSKAANTMEGAGLYAEAASIYLKYGQDKNKAAECYEKGKIYSEAIELYKELGENEKAGDLCLIINKIEEANFYFQKAVDVYSEHQRFVKASLVCKNKMKNLEAAQKMLLKGWSADRDAFNCLNNYFKNIEDLNLLRSEVERVYKEEIVSKDRELFLKILHHEYQKENELSGFFRDMAYTIVSEEAARRPEFVSELQKFNKKDKELLKDIIRFNRG